MELISLAGKKIYFHKALERQSSPEPRTNYGKTDDCSHCYHRRPHTEEQHRAALLSNSTGKEDVVQPVSKVSSERLVTKGVQLAIVLKSILRKGKDWEHPVSKKQLRWAWAAENRGELEPGTAHKWAKRAKEKKLPESHSRDGG